MKQRLYPAAFKVLVGLLITFLAIGITTKVLRVGGDVANEGTQGVIECFSASLRGGDVTQGVSLASSWRNQYDHEVPRIFEEEVMPVSGLHPLVSSDGFTVGFTYDGRVEEAAEFVCDQVEQRGWSFVKSGHDAFSTFIKDTGSFKWLGVTCVEKNETTSVVMVVQEGGGAGGA